MGRPLSSHLSARGRIELSDAAANRPHVSVIGEEIFVSIQVECLLRVEIRQREHQVAFFAVFALR